MSNALNTREPITLTINRRGQAPVQVVLNWPSDEDWIRREECRTDAHRTLADGGYDFLGNDMDRLDATDLEIFKRIHVSGEYSEDDALRALDELSTALLLKEKDPLTVEIVILGVTVRHVMRQPSYKVERRWRMNNTITRLVADKRFSIDNLRLAGDVHAALLDRTEGYDGPVPITHKLWVVKEIFARLDKAEANDGKGSNDLDPKGF